MEEVSLIYIICGVWGLQFLIILIVGAYYSMVKVEVGKDCYKEVTVIIPVKNEAERIHDLIHSINELTEDQIKVEYIFVDDHSADNSVELINSKLKKTFKLTTNDGRGKKQAIKSGIDQSSFENVLTWDADVSVDQDYFAQLSQLEKAEMWVLPVRLSGKSLVSRLGAIDHAWLQMLNFTYGSKKGPMISSGANLLFKKSTFLEVDSSRTDYEIPSGDDMFLMDAFKKAGKKIRISNQMNLEVITESPANFENLVAQRKRWSSKMKHLKSVPAFLAGLLVILLSILNILGLFWGVISGQLLILLAFLIKYISEYLYLRFYKGSVDAGIDLWVVFLHQFFFPFYLLSIVSSSKKENRWTLEEN